MRKDFAPQLLPNEEIDMKYIKFPIFVSKKLDGVRVCFKDGQMLSRSLKPIPNKQLQEKFQFLKDLSLQTGLIYDGEIYAHSMSFQDIVSYVMTQDLDDPKSIKKHGVRTIPEELKFHIFDIFDPKNPDKIFNKRYNELIFNLIGLYHNYKKIEMLTQDLIFNKQELQTTLEIALLNGYEGAVLINPESVYKFGRITLNSGMAYKIKPYRTFDAQIIGVVQSTVVDPLAEKTINELGNSVTSKKKDDRIPIEKASAFWVEYEGTQLKVSLAMTDEEKEEVWKNAQNYLGRWIEYKGMLVGAKDVPRHPVFIRFRDDKDEEAKV